MSTTPKKLWEPSQSFKSESNLQAYMDWLRSKKELSFGDYDELWRWSIDHTRDFWGSLYEYFQIIDHGECRSVHDDAPMPETTWFEGSKINYAEHIFRQEQAGKDAIIFKQEGNETVSMSWGELRQQVAAVRAYLQAQGVTKGDRVVAYIPNIPQAVVGFLASCSLGAVWSSCSPDFGANSVVDRFKQIEPKVLITVDGYRYQGKSHDRVETVHQILSELPSIQSVLQIPYLHQVAFVDYAATWDDVVSQDASLDFTAVDFADPIWVLYSSGTTGQPKAITHSQGGVLLEHLKYVTFHNDVKAGEKYFWFTTTGWMMWNFVQSTLLAGATIVLYDGSPGYPGLDALWKFSEEVGINHFGTSAPFIVACMNKKLEPGKKFDLSSLRSISSTGSPLPPEGFDWIYEKVKSDVWLCSMSGGTDVCSAFVGGCPLEPLYEGEIQRRALGCAMFAYDDHGKALVNEVGEMVVTKPMPSMPIYFWGDVRKERYKESYFEEYPGVWRHGDWLLITDRNTLVIKGRSDATLNRHGIRIGTAEIYQSVDKLESIKDSLIVNLELAGGKHFMPLFVVMKEGTHLTDKVKEEINRQLTNDFSRRHVPDEVIEVKDIPYTISGKKMEAPVKKILMGKNKQNAANLGAMRNPESLQFFEDYAFEHQFNS
ncbi:acetoacetate--CoA ligase [Marinoscillum sp.]|uniref:acetoacetate--CoA ligase n=1 Tax=Marinoscillum sp. TaxID=2024838 RepID=UPI003BAB761C